MPVIMSLLHILITFYLHKYFINNSLSISRVCQYIIFLNKYIGKFEGKKTEQKKIFFCITRPILNSNCFFPR